MTAVLVEHSRRSSSNVWLPSRLLLWRTSTRRLLPVKCTSKFNFSGRYSVHLYLQKRSSLRFHGSWPPVQIFWMSYFILYCFYRVDTTFYCWIINRFTIFSKIWFSTCFPDSLGEINKNVPFCCLRKIQWPPTVSESWVQSALPPLLLCTWTHIRIRKPHNLWART